MTATCELFRFDDPETYSAGEAILFNPQGGGVALLTTTRTVYSSGNQQVNRAFFETALDDAQGRCLGDIYRDTKNSDQITSHTNSRNFSLMGDPALELAYPSEHVYLTQVPDTMRSLDEVLVRGYVGNAQGDTLTDFDGVVVPTVFDKRASVTTLDNDFSEGPFTYEVFQNILHKGLASVVDGVFEFRFIVPRDLNYDFGPGRISCYALSETTDAHGYTESFIIGGTSDNPTLDDAGPEVQLYMNDSLFLPGTSCTRIRGCLPGFLTTVASTPRAMELATTPRPFWTATQAGPSFSTNTSCRISTPTNAAASVFRSKDSARENTIWS